MEEEFDVNRFISELEENKKDICDYNTLKNEICDLFQRLILEGKIQNSGYILAVGSLLIGKNLSEMVFTKEDLPVVYEKVLGVKCHYNQ